MSLTDSEFIHQIEARTLPKGQLTHRNHVRLAWLYLKAYGRDEASVRLPRTIERYAIAVGAATTFDHGLTLAWLEIIDAARMASRSETFTTFIAEHPELLDKALVSWTPISG